MRGGSPFTRPAIRDVLLDGRAVAELEPIRVIGADAQKGELWYVPLTPGGEPMRRQGEIVVAMRRGVVTLHQPQGAPHGR